MIREKKIAVLDAVREYSEKDAVELWLHENGRVVIKAYNECHNNCTEIDLVDLLQWSASKWIIHEEVKA